MKRLFDVLVAAILLLIFAPITMIVAICIRLDSPGPILYASPRIGRDGKLFGLLRFRTVRIDQPSYLSMKERLSRVGCFIRNYSLDDLPNLFNILHGDLTIIGPRPTEPERVDLTDPIWQKILAVRPGVFSPAVMILAQQYNASPKSLKQQLEFAYVQKQSFGYDLSLFQQAIRGLFISKGNWKARGKPVGEIEYAYLQANAASTLTAKEVSPNDYSWSLAGWDQPDLSDVAAFVQKVGQTCVEYEPQFCLVPCANLTQKPAIFLRVGEDDGRWTETIELRDIQWFIAATNRYVCLGCVLYFEEQVPMNLSGEHGQFEALPRTHQRIACSTLLDVASTVVESWFSRWRDSSDTIIFLVMPELVAMQYRFWVRDGEDSPKAQAIQQWEEAKARLLQSRYALENFAEESKLLRETLQQ